MRKWDELPKFMRTDEVKQYYDILIRHEKELRLKRYFDILLSMILLVILSPIMLVISIAIKLDSPGPVIYKQVRVTQYGKGYTKEMYATLLLPAGITSRASVCYKDEGEMLEHVEDVDYAYIHEVLPEKMSYNLEDLRKYSLWRDFMTMFMTVFAVLR